MGNSEADTTGIGNPPRTSKTRENSFLFSSEAAFGDAEISDATQNSGDERNLQLSVIRCFARFTAPNVTEISVTSMAVFKLRSDNRESVSRYSMSYFTLESLIPRSVIPKEGISRRKPNSDASQEPHESKPIKAVESAGLICSLIEFRSDSRQSFINSVLFIKGPSLI